MFSPTPKGATMSDAFFRKTQRCKQKIEFTREEKAMLNTVIDLIIPSDEHFPPPSSLSLSDELVRHLQPGISNYLSLMLDQERLRTMLSTLNISADGHFCKLEQEQQQSLLNSLEQQDPASFQALWTLVNHSYYAHMAMRAPMSLSST